MKTFRSYLKEISGGALHHNAKDSIDKEKEILQKKIEKEKLANKLAKEKLQGKKDKLAVDKAKSKARENTKKAKETSKKESIVNKVVEYIKSDGARKKCAGGDGRRTENHDCDKVHSDMSHKEWEASQDTPKDEGKDGGTGDKAAYKKFFDAKLKKYGVTSPSQLKGDDKKKFYDEIDAEWEGDNETD
jgi:hypothetical protein